jgi:hypothetical protein
MVLLLLSDGSSAEIPTCTEVVRESHYLVCCDATGTRVGAMPMSEVRAYTFNPYVVQELIGQPRDGAEAPTRKRRGRRRRHAEAAAALAAPPLRTSRRRRSFLV